MPLSTIFNGASSATAREAINAAINQLNNSLPTGTRITGYWPVAPSGYVLANGNSIGNAASGADRANADTQALFLLLWEMWDLVPSGVLAADKLFDSTGSETTPTTAAADYAAGCRLVIPDEQRRVAVMHQSGGTIVGWDADLGASGGDETVTLLTTQIPAHSHSLNYSSSGVSEAVVGSGTQFVTSITPSGSATGVSTTNQGGGEAHNNVQPFISVNVAIKL